MTIKQTLLAIIFTLTNYISYSQDSSGYKIINSDKMPNLPKTVTVKREYNQDSTILLLVNERKYEGQDWQTNFEFAYFTKNKRLINGGLIFGCSEKGLDFEFTWIAENKIRVIIPKGVRYFKKNTTIELGRDRSGNLMDGVTPKTIYITYEEK